MLAENHSSLLGNVSAVNNCIERHPGFFQGIFHEGVIIRRDYDHRVQGRRGQKSMNLGDVPRSKICAACLPAGYLDLSSCNRKLPEPSSRYRAAATRASWQASLCSPPARRRWEESLRREHTAIHFRMVAHTMEPLLQEKEQWCDS
jgi:hypothetical protein